MEKLTRDYFLQRSKNFCMAPWVHMHLWPDGSAFPCCLSDTSQPVGQYGKSNLSGLWNSEKMRALRTNMLADKPSPECHRCYTLEQSAQVYTLRKTMNHGYAGHWDQVISTKKDGTVDEIRMAYLDIRFSNLCNFRCQTCGPRLSTGWFDDQVKAYGNPGHPKLLRIEPSELFWKELEPLLLGVESVYFAGGEPLLSEEHYRILDFWIEKKKLDVSIEYTTNFSQLPAKQGKAFAYWTNFSRVKVVASLDASGARAEYLRKGTHWDTIVKNRELMLKECPQVRFEITPTISAYNLLHFPDFHLEWIERGLIKINEMRLNLLTFPPEMSIQMLPRSLKTKAEEKYRKTMEHLIRLAESRGEPYHFMQEGYQSVIEFLWKVDQTHLTSNFLKRASEIDAVRNEDLFSVFPELEALRDTASRRAGEASGEAL